MSACPAFAGGFVGVDIFFVISGYLICGMIDADIRKGSFSLANFYKRRILRILPALFVMFLVTSVLACVLLPAGRTRGLREEPRQRRGVDLECLLCADRRLFRRSGRNQAAAAYLVARRRRAVLLRRSPADAVGLALRAEARRTAVRNRRRGFPLRRRSGHERSKPHLCVLSHAVPGLGTGARRAARRSDSFPRRKPPSGETPVARRDCCSCSASSFSDRRRCRSW